MVKCEDKVMSEFYSRGTLQSKIQVKQKSKETEREQTSASKEVLESPLIAQSCEKRVAHFPAFLNLPIR